MNVEVALGIIQSEMRAYTCLSCGFPYPDYGLPHRCPDCGGIFSVTGVEYLVEQYQNSRLPGLWRFMPSFDLDPTASPVYLGEGNTPLVEKVFKGKRLYFKCEHLNPSGSFKDRQSAVLVSLLRARGIETVLEDSSGNAGASLAQYAAAAGVKAKIFIPCSSSGPKRQQIELSGADVVLVDGPRRNAARAVLEEQSKSDVAYASHALLPFGLVAYATIAFEVYEKLGRMPKRVFAPIGHGSLFLGLLMGFEAIGTRTGELRPRMVGVQAEHCAPVYRAWAGLPAALVRPSLAEGTAVSDPVRGPEIIGKLISDFDELVSVKEEDIARSQYELMGMGFYVEPTAALVWAAAQTLAKETAQLEDDWVFILSGNGLKSINE